MDHEISKEYLEKKHNKDMIQLNEEMLSSVDALVGSSSYYVLEMLGNSICDGLNTIDSHPSLVMSYLIFKQSWAMPDNIRETLEAYIDKIHEDAK